MKRPRLTSPLLPNGVEIIVPPPAYEACTFLDKFLVYASSLIVVGSPLWFYGGIVYLYRRWKKYRALASLLKGGNAAMCDGGRTSSGESSQERPDNNMEQYTIYKRLASRYGAALAMLLLISIWGPHRSKRLGEWLGVRKWRLWDAWDHYNGYTVLHDRGEDKGKLPNKSSFDHQDFDIQKSPAILAFVPHGIFPFGLAFSCLPGRYQETWGLFRPVVATATKFFPLVRTFLAWLGSIDASRSAVSAALAQPTDGATTANPRRVGVSPGGIAEMFQSYPKPGFHPDDEAALLKGRNGLFKLALRHNVPIVPVYTFGATKMFRRVQLPQFIETLSRALKISLCLLFGKLGLPIPFRQRMVYVIGKTIWPTLTNNIDTTNLQGEEFDRLVQEMHDAFCNEIKRIFDRNKGHYGWGNKTLRFV